MKRKLIEVAMPLDTINKLSIEEKDIHTGHPANLHMWWARRPLAACRAVLFASVIDDPGNHLPPIEAKRERQRLFALIDRMCRWDNAVDPKTLKEVRAEIMKATGGTRLTVADPFCGGGAIPIEAQRLGFDAVGSDLNPVAVMVTKTMTELVPRVIGHKPVHPGAKLSTESDWSKAQGLIEDVAFYGRWMREQAYARIGRYFPQSIGGGEVVSWLWARAIACPSPACRTLMPLVPSYAVSTHAGREAYVKPVVDAKAKRVRFEIVAKDPKADPTVGRRGGKCLACGSAIPLAYIRAEAVAGRMTYELLAIAVDTKSGREYREAVAEQVQLAAKAEPSWVPDTVLPPQGTRIPCSSLRHDAACRPLHSAPDALYFYVQ